MTNEIVPLRGDYVGPFYTQICFKNGENQKVGNGIRVYSWLYKYLFSRFVEITSVTVLLNQKKVTLNLDTKALTKWLGLCEEILGTKTDTYDAGSVDQKIQQICRNYYEHTFYTAEVNLLEEKASLIGGRPRSDAITDKKWRVVRKRDYTIQVAVRRDTFHRFSYDFD
jgi:hypothetical protein